MTKRKLHKPLMLGYDEDQHVRWEKPSNLHDKIIYFVYRRAFEEYLAKWRRMGMTP